MRLMKGNWNEEKAWEKKQTNERKLEGEELERKL